MAKLDAIHKATRHTGMRSHDTKKLGVRIVLRGLVVENRHRAPDLDFVVCNQLPHVDNRHTLAAGGKARAVRMHADRVDGRLCLLLACV
jgi:hypothetical protein